MKDLFILSLLIVIVYSGCPNGCSGHGRCISGVCECFGKEGIDDGKSYTGNDCSLLKCAEGNPFFSSVSSYSVSEGSVFGYFVRELSSINKSRNLEVSESVMKINGVIDGGDSGSLWNVSVSDNFLKALPKMGGYIQCSYSVGEGVGAREVSDSKIEVIGVSEDKKTAYLKFETAIKLKSIKCNRILSIRKSMVYYNEEENTVKTEKTIEWNNYGKIFKELGILTEEKSAGARGQVGGEGGGKGRRASAGGAGGDQADPVTYSSKEFIFICYKSSNALTIYEAVEATLVNNDLQFKFPETPGLDASSYCYCLMDNEAKPTTIDITELNDIVKDNKVTKHTFPENENEIDENGNAIIALTGAVEVTEQNQAPVPVETVAEADFIVDNRVVYVDVLNKGIITEKEVKIGFQAERMIRQLSTTFTLSSTGDVPQLENGDIILPYIKMHSSNPTKETKPIIDGNDLGTNLFKVYSLADVMISQLDEKVGGKLECSYEKGNINIDVKGYKKSTFKEKNHVIFSYIQFPNADSVGKINTLKCSKIISKRKDFTLYNPLKLTTEGNVYVSSKLTWKGYKDILEGVTFESSTVSFACYKEGENNNKLTIHTGVTVAKPDQASNNHVSFTFTNTPPSRPSAGEICYLLADSAGKSITDLKQSDLGSYITEIEDDKGVKTYYYGKYPKPSKGEILVEPDDDGSPIFILDTSKESNNKIENDKIRIDVNELTNDDLEYFEIGKIIYIEVVGSDNIPYNHKAKITSIDEERERLLSDNKNNKIKTYTYIPSISSDATPTGSIKSSPELNVEIHKGYTNNEDRIYKVSNFFDELVLKLNPVFGGKLQCKYAKTTTADTKEYSSGFVDVKGYVMNGEGNINYGYFQFDHEVVSQSKKTEPELPVYYIDDIDCNEIISERKDMSLYNPTTVSDNKITWIKYGSILTAIGFTKTSGIFRFACYNPKSEDNNKKLVKIYDSLEVTIPSGNGNVEFTFKTDDKPKDDDMCYLLSDEKGNSIDIESSDLFEFVRRDDNDGNYYYGKYVNTDDKTKEIIQNNDGSQTIILGKELFTIEEDDDKDKDKINIVNLDNPDSPSIAFPPSLISDGIKKLMIPGTTIIFILEGSIQSTQILKVKVIETNKGNNQKFELILSKSIAIKRLRSLATTTPSSSVIMKFSSENSVHKPLECSGQGICDRVNGKCKCYEGYSGSSCERLDCPSNCNGNGRCVSLSELLSNSEIENGYEGFGNKHESVYDNVDGSMNRVKFENQVFGCLCDKRHRGYDCSLIECPSDKDPEGVSNQNGLDYRDCSGRGICDYSRGVCECFDGFVGEGCQLQVGTM